MTLITKASARNFQQIPRPISPSKDTAEELPNSHSYKNITILLASIFLIFSVIAYTVTFFAGAQISRAGHSENTKAMAIVIAGDVVNLQSNHIRYPSQRTTQIAKRLDLYIHWPSMNGYSKSLAAKFNDLKDRREIIFATLVPRHSNLDMSARYTPLYKKYIDISAPQGNITKLNYYAMDPAAGFIDEQLYVESNSPYPYVVRCARAPQKSIVPYCIRDIHIGGNLSLTYRFHVDLIPQWRALEHEIRKMFVGALKPKF